MSNFIIGLIRTVIPLIVAWAVGLLTAANIDVDPDLVAGLSASAGALAASLYYIGVAWLERSWPWFGWLLGVARNPVYAAPAPKHSA